jgi:hypothetical protein
MSRAVLRPSAIAAGHTGRTAALGLGPEREELLLPARSLPELPERTDLRAAALP